jgi:phosphatidylglycerol:prolipoprotein diacylglycerol transferase
MNLLAIRIHIDPNIGEFGPLLLTWHGVFTAVGIAAAVLVTAFFARRRGILEDDIYNIALVAIPGGIIGARALFVLENWEFFRGNLRDIISVNEGGISVYGGLIGGTLAGWSFAWWRKYRMRAISDCTAFGLLVGLSIGRIGDYINGEHLAKTSNLPWAFCYTHPNTLQEPICGPGLLGGQAVHPVAGLYEPLLMLVMLGALLYLRTRITKDGYLFWIFVAMYALMRFFLSYLRTNEATAGPLTVPQWVALGMLVVAAVGAYIVSRMPETSAPPPSRAQRRAALSGTRGARS